MKVTVGFGVQNSATIQVPEGKTIRDLVADRNLRGTLGFPENVSALVNGVPISLDARVNEGDNVQLVNAPGQKAA